MINVPELIYRYLANRNVGQLAPAWLQLAPNGTSVHTVGGAWENYFDSLPERGSQVSDLCEALHGILPAPDTFELSQMQLHPDQYTDICLLQDNTGDWLLFCDVTESTLQLQKYQQTANELILLKGKLNRTLDRYVGQEVAERAANGTLQFNAEGERKAITTLFVDIRGFTAFNERHDAQLVVHTLNEYMDCMLLPIMDQAGIIDKITGDGAMAVFGVLESEKHTCDNAFAAATNIINKASLLNKKRAAQQAEALGVGVGIATGEAVLGILGSHRRRAFTAIGRHVNLASRLESNAKPGEILMDETTFKKLNQPTLCSPITLELKGIGKVQAFSCKP